MSRFYPNIPCLSVDGTAFALLCGILFIPGRVPAQTPTSAPTPTATSVTTPSPTPSATPLKVKTPIPGLDLSVVPVPETPPSHPSSTAMEASFDFAQGVILLDVDISGGHVVKLALDTGDEDSVLDRELARELKLPFDKLPDHVLNLPRGKGPDISTPQITVSESKIGTGDFFDQDFLILPLKDELAEMGIKCQGTIGYRFFAGQVVQIDYPARKLRLLPAAPVPPPGTLVLPIQWKQYDPKGPGLVTTDQLHLGDHAIVAQYDTLFARTLILFTTKLPWLESKRLPDLPSAYYEQGVLRAALPLLPVSLGDHHFSLALPAYLADKDANLPTTDIGAVMGNLFFLDAVVTLDYKNNKMYVEWKE